MITTNLRLRYYWFYLFSADFQLIIFLFMMLRLCAVPSLSRPPAVIVSVYLLVTRTDNHKFAIALLLAVIDELERIYKEMMKNADTATSIY